MKKSGHFDGGVCQEFWNYNLSDVNQDGFIDELDGMILYPQGHGDAWGHYLSAMRARYSLLRHPYFNWQTRSELYNLQDVVIEVDYLDERKFAQTAAAKARAGTEAVNLTYRSHYVEDPDGQWQGYTDSDPQRAWGVTEWARRAGQGALFDWITANALLPAENPDPSKEGIERVQRSTVPDLAEVSSQLGAVQKVYDDANAGLNPVGLHQDVVPFDIDPTFLQVGSTTQIGRRAVQGLSHFDQILERAVAALNNALTAFDYAAAYRNQIRQVADSTDKFRQEVIEQDLEYRNRLIEIFGTPYRGTMGPGKPYPEGYSGPDLSLYMYVDVREVSKETVPTPLGDPGDENYATSYLGRLTAFAKDLKQYDGEFEDLVDRNFLNTLEDPDSLQSVVSWTNVNILDPVTGESTILELNLPINGSGNPLIARGYSFQAPADWEYREAPGRLQNLITEMVQAEADLALAMGDYDLLISQIEWATDALSSKIDFAGESQDISEARRDATIAIDTIIDTVQTVTAVSQAALEVISAASQTVADTLDGLYIVGFSNGENFSGKSLRAAFKAASEASVEATRKASEESNGKISQDASDKVRKAAHNKSLKSFLRRAKTNTKAQLKVGNDIAQAGSKALAGLNTLVEYPQLALNIINATYDEQLLVQEFNVEIKEKITEIKQLLINEGTTRISVLKAQERLRGLSENYRSTLQEGFRLIEERRNFNVKTAAKTQQNRYQDMSFRVARNHALEKYRASFDLAARYVYLAAKAYDFDTNLSQDDPASAQPLLTQIIRERTLGQMAGGEPMHVGGLAGVLAVLRDNFAVLYGQLGLNNPILEDNHFSLRRELFGLSSTEQSDKTPWQTKLIQARVGNLWQIPEFRRYCRPFGPYDPNTPEPGLVIRFGTEIVAGKNFFKRLLMPGDSAYDPSVYSTRVVGVRVSFEGYNTLNLAATPRVYFVPVGEDVMYEPSSTGYDTTYDPAHPTLAKRFWRVMDQRIPVPFNTSRSDLANPAWIPVIDSLNGTLGEIRRHSALLANITTTVGDDFTFDTRLIGRSAWNTEWMLIIPGRMLLYDPNIGLDRLINDVTDIQLSLSTYGTAGN